MKLALFILAVLAFAAPTARGQSLWDYAYGDVGGESGVATGSLFSDVAPKPVRYKVHDLITVIIEESAKSLLRSDVKLQADTSVDTELEDFIRFSGSGKNRRLVPAFLGRKNPLISLDSELELQRKANLRSVSEYKDRITCEIVAVYPNGTFEIAGQKVRKVADYWETVRLTGVVDQRFVNTDSSSPLFMTLRSGRVANANIQIAVDGAVASWSQMSWFQRLMGILWPF